MNFIQLRNALEFIEAELREEILDHFWSGKLKSVTFHCDLGDLEHQLDSVEPNSYKTLHRYVTYELHD